MNEAISAIRCDKDHKYWHRRSSGEVRVPGFSEILRDLNITEENKYYTEFGRDRGTAVHQWIRFLAEGNEPDAQPDERIAGFLAAFKSFIKESDFLFRGGEEPFYHPSLVYATTPDLFGYMNDRPCVIDIKTGGKLPFHGLQTAAQKLAIRANTLPCDDRYALYIKDGKYRLEAHKDRADEMRWTAIVTAFHAKSFYSNRSAL